jgi:hypothetical protein
MKIIMSAKKIKYLKIIFIGNTLIYYEINPQNFWDLDFEDDDEYEKYIFSVR